MDGGVPHALGRRSGISLDAHYCSEAESGPHPRDFSGRAAVSAYRRPARVARIRQSRDAGFPFPPRGAETLVRKRFLAAANAVAVFGALLLIWQLILWIFHVPSFMLPSPWAVARAVVARFPSLLTSLAVTAGG